MAQLIGKKCMVSCAINGVPVRMLFNSGPQVTIVESDWVGKELPDVGIQPLETLLADSPQTVAAANGAEVPFDDWIDVTLAIVSENRGSVMVQVPMLVVQSSIRFQLLGSNVIAKMIKGNGQTNEVDIGSLLKEALKVSKDAARVIVSHLSAAIDEEPLQYDTGVGKKGLTIPKGQIGKVRCRIRAWPKGRTVLYEPAIDSNQSLFRK